MKPKWKVLVELALSVIFFLLGGYNLNRAVDFYPDASFLAYGALGLLLIWFSADRIKEHWNEL